jgi:hypothetical protein
MEMFNRGGGTGPPGDAGTAWGIGPAPQQVPGDAGTMATGGADALASTPASPFRTGPSDGVLIARGLGLGAVAAVVAAALWTLVVALSGYQVGVAAIAVALLVATAVRFGSAGLASTPLRAGSVGLTVVSMAVAEYLVVRHFVNAELAAEGIAETVPLLISPVDMVLVVIESLQFDPLTLVFWAIAVFAAWRYSAPNEA